MKREIACQVFEEQLDALGRGQLSNEGVGQLRRHGAECTDCGTQLRVQEHLVGPTLEELEAAVSQSLVDSVWPRVSTELAERIRTPHATWWTKHSRGWWMPSMAAASLGILVLAGFLFAELRKAEARERALTRQVAEQARILARAEEDGSNAVHRTARLGGISPWVRALSRQERVSVEELRELLQTLPRGTTLLSPSDVDAVLAGTPAWTPPALRNVLEQLGTQDGIRAEDLLRLLELRGIRSDMSLATSRLRRFLN